MKSTANYPKFWEMDLSNSIKPYEFSKEAFHKIDHIIDADDFLDMDSGEILNYLLKELHLISFGDYLKRYLYLELEPKETYGELKDEFYINLIMTSFKENHVPFHMDACTTSPRRMISRWLAQGTVGRPVVFLLGFGLRMNRETVSEFLQKALLEEDFNFEDPKEVIFWYCYEHNKPYSFAMQLLDEYEMMKQQTDKKTAKFVSWKEMTKRLSYKMDSLKILRKYLAQLKKRQQGPASSDAFIVFSELYDEVCKRIIQLRINESRDVKKTVNRNVTPADVEKELYAGIPRSKGGNLQKASLSLLSSYMNNHYLSRQRMEKLLNGKYLVRRFDILNLCFFLHGSLGSQNRSLKEYFLSFVEDVNKRLEKSHMFCLHPSNPSEAFMMICLFTEMPLITYSDVLEASFTWNGTELEK